MTLIEYNSKYKYVTDTAKYGRVEYWSIMEPDAEGMYKGDCEDYVLTLRKYVDGYEDWDIAFCYIHGEGHAVAYKDDKIIDCNCRCPLDKEEYTSRYDMTGWVALPEIEVTRRMMVAKYNKYKRTVGMWGILVAAAVLAAGANLIYG